MFNSVSDLVFSSTQNPISNEDFNIKLKELFKSDNKQSKQKTDDISGFNLGRRSRGDLPDSSRPQLIESSQSERELFKTRRLKKLNPYQSPILRGRFYPDLIRLMIFLERKLHLQDQLELEQKEGESKVQSGLTHTELTRRVQEKIKETPEDLRDWIFDLLESPPTKQETIRRSVVIIAAEDILASYDMDQQGLLIHTPTQARYPTKHIFIAGVVHKIAEFYLANPTAINHVNELGGHPFCAHFRREKGKLFIFAAFKRLAFGTVSTAHLALDMNRSEQVVIKTPNDIDPMNRNLNRLVVLMRNIQLMKDEATVIKKIHKDEYVKAFSPPPIATFDLDRNIFAMVIRYYNGGDLAHYLKAHRVDLATKIKICTQIWLLFMECVNEGVYPPDVKPGNTLVDATNLKDPKLIFADLAGTKFEDDPLDPSPTWFTAAYCCPHLANLIKTAINVGDTESINNFRYQQLRFNCLSMIFSTLSKGAFPRKYVQWQYPDLSDPVRVEALQQEDCPKVICDLLETTLQKDHKKRFLINDEGVKKILEEGLRQAEEEAKANPPCVVKLTPSKQVSPFKIPSASPKGTPKTVLLDKTPLKQTPQPSKDTPKTVPISKTSNASSLKRKLSQQETRENATEASGKKQKVSPACGNSNTDSAQKRALKELSPQVVAPQNGKQQKFDSPRNPNPTLARHKSKMAAQGISPVKFSLPD